MYASGQYGRGWARVGVLAVVLAVACGGEGPAGDAAPADVTLRADSLQQVVDSLREALRVAQAAAREARAAAEPPASEPARREAPGAAVTDAEASAAEPFRGPVAVELSAALLRFPGDRGSTITYVGAVRDGKANGLGYAVWSTGSAYEGQWRDNRRHGPGRHSYPDGAVYEGQYVDDVREGRGTYHYRNGQRWEGPWKDNLRHGEGVLYEADGRVRVRGVWERDRLVREIKD